jgi:hypothetical protein
MDSNTAHKKILEFAPSVPFSQFEDILMNQSSPSNPVKVEWTTMEGNTRYYDMFWIDGPIGNGIDGGTDTKEAEGMVNISVVGLEGKWRTLTWDTVKKFRFNNKTYNVI